MMDIKVIQSLSVIIPSIICCFIMKKINLNNRFYPIYVLVINVVFLTYLWFFG